MAMTMSEFVTAFTSDLDEVLATQSITAPFDAQGVEFTGARTVKVPKITVQDLADYDKSNGFVEGTNSFEWESFTLANDKSASTTIDAIDNLDELSVPAAVWAGEIVRTKAIPAINKNFLTKVAAAAGTKATEALTKANIVDEITKGRNALGQVGVSMDGAYLYMTYEAKSLLEAAHYDLYHTPLEGDMFLGAKVVAVADDQIDQDFVLIGAGCAKNIMKHQATRVFTPEVNQLKDGYKIDYRVAFDAIVEDNKAAGIYANKGAQG